MNQAISNILLGEPGPEDRFMIRYGWFRFHLSIKPLSARQMIRISGEWSRIKDIDKNKDMFPALMENVSDLKYIARVIAISTGTKFPKLVTRAILKLKLKDIQRLFAIVQKQCDSEVFFYIIISAKGIIRTITKQGE